MIWKKNAVSYLIWMVYAAMAGSGFVWILVSILRRNAVPDSIALAAGAAVLVAEAILVLLLYKRPVKEKAVVSIVTPRLAAECILAIGLLAAGVFLRINDLPAAETASVYMDAAQVAEGQSIPLLVHGIEYLYLQMLHLVFLLFGNKLLAGIWCQMVLQLLACVFLYCAVRKLAGGAAAVTAAGFLMLSPMLRQEVLQLSSRNLFLFIFGFVLFLLAQLMMAQRGRPAACFAAGILTLLVVYLDILGAVVLLLAVGMLLAQNGRPFTGWNSRWVLLILYLLGCTAGALAAFGADAYISGKEPVNIVLAWWTLFAPKGFASVLGQSGLLERGTWETLILLAVMCIGIFSFWCRHRTEQQSIWTLCCVAVLGLQTFGMTTRQLDGDMLLYFFCAVCAGMGICNLFRMRRDFVPAEGRNRPERKGMEGEAEPQKMHSVQEKKREAFRVMGIEEIEELEETKAEKAEGTMREAEKSEAEGLEEIVYIENPLPLPKKHVKRVLDYGVQIPESDDFDIAVQEEDDFDL